MFEQSAISHTIQRHILEILLHVKYARFRDLRPPRTDTNLFSYHLKVLISQHYVEKTIHGYTLSTKGLVYVDRVSTSQKMAVRIQPKIVTMLVIQNSDGDILLQRRTKQPYIDTWTLPYGKLHIEDESLKAAAVREALDKISVSSAPVEHAGDCYIRVKNNGKAVTTTLAHVFRFDDDTIRTTDDVKWFRPHKISQLDLAPAVQEIVARTFFRDDFFFEEYEVDLHAST